MEMSHEKIDQFTNVHKVHCVGIGGIGLSGFARMMHDKGKTVTGSDQDSTELTEALQSEGIECFIGHESSYVEEDTDLVVYSPAVPENNPELLIARENGIKTVTYPEALGMISEGMFTIAVSGTHGKTTTTAMIAEILFKAGLQPTVIVGSLLKEYNSNYISGNGSIFIVEACEYKRSFTHLSPDIFVITNVEEDHLDYYKDLADIQSAFKEVIGNMKAGGIVVANVCQDAIGGIVDDAVVELDDYSELSIPDDVVLVGKHNYENAKAARAVASRLKVVEEDFVEAMQNFSGTWRRMEDRGTLSNGAKWIDDYGHHPTEIKATLDGIREANPDKKIHVIFEPHLHSRTKDLLTEFGESFTDADHVYLLPIYEARTETDHDISHADVAQEIEKHSISTTVCETFKECSEIVIDDTDEGSVVVTMGAGNVYQVFE